MNLIQTACSSSKEIFRKKKRRRQKMSKLCIEGNLCHKQWAYIGVKFQTCFSFLCLFDCHGCIFFSIGHLFYLSWLILLPVIHLARVSLSYRRHCQPCPVKWIIWLQQITIRSKKIKELAQRKEEAAMPARKAEKSKKPKVFFKDT